MTYDFRSDPRFAGITPFQTKLWLSSPTMHGDEQQWVDEAIQTNWVSTVGANIDEVEKLIAGYVGVRYAVGVRDRRSLSIIPILRRPLRTQSRGMIPPVYREWESI